MEFYCMKCRGKVKVKDYNTEDITVKGQKRRLLRANCPKCSTKMTKFAKI